MHTLDRCVRCQVQSTDSCCKAHADAFGLQAQDLGCEEPCVHVQALWDGDANNLKAWLLKCPRNQVRNHILLLECTCVLHFAGAFTHAQFCRLAVLLSGYHCERCAAKCVTTPHQSSRCCMCCR